MPALSLLPVGQAAIIETLQLPEAVEHHLMHMGFTPDARVVAVRRAPAGDPTVYAIDGMEIALRRETARAIFVRPVAAGGESGAPHEEQGESAGGQAEIVRFSRAGRETRAARVMA